MKIFKRIIIGVLIVIVLAVFVLFIYLKGTQPALNGRFTTFRGSTTDKIVIERDRWGVPIINAANENDMFWGMGFAHASDRLFQMDLIRRLATGHLSEVFGKRALESDKEQMDLMIEEGIQRSIGKMDPELKKIVESYCRGVNYYMDNCSLPPEFKLLGYSPEPWQIRDIFAIFKRMEIILAGSGSELYNAKVYSAVGKEKADELLTGSHGSPIVNEEEYKMFLNNKTLRSAYHRELENLEKKIGSNNWVISGSRTASGKPILANDPHLSNVFPSYFYQVRLKSGDTELSGNSIAGAPFIIIGKNAKVSWGFTNVGTDVIDYFALETIPGDDMNYILDGEKVPFTILEKHIRIKGEEDYIHQVKVSKFGAVLKSGDKLLARHSVNEYPSTVLDALYKLNFAGNAAEAVNAFKLWSSPAQNAVFADSEGNIGYYPTGLIPIRGSGDGSFPVSGKTINNLWKGFHNEEDKPVIINPEKGFIVTANNRVVPEYGIPLFAKNWFPSFRADRIAELLLREKKIDVEDNMKIQTDSFLKSGEFIMKIIGNHKPVSGDASFILNELKKWDLKADSGTTPFIFYRFEKILTEEMFSDEFNEESQPLISRSWIYRLLNYPTGNIDTASVEKWADDKRTEMKETFSDIIERALSLTNSEYLSKKERGAVHWTDIHTLKYSHPLGSVFPLKYFLNRGPYGVTGGKDCIMVSTFRNRDDFNVVHLSTFRMIIDMGDQTHSKMINSSGQSGHFMSRFYDDQIELYTAGRYRSFENPPVGKYRIEIVPE